MTQQVSFIHTSDLHLNSEKERKEVFTKITTLCIDKKVDALIIAGDLFSDSNPSLGTQRFVVGQFKKLNNNNIRIFLIAGDHDSDLAANKSFLKNLPKKVVFFDKGKKFSSDHYEVYGRSYARNREKIAINSTKKPVIGLFHGLINETGIKQLAQYNLSYIALGHFHDYTKVASKTPCYYSGSPVPSLFYKKKSRFVILVHLDERKAQPIKIKL